MKTLKLIYSRHNVNAPPRPSTLHTLSFNDLTIVFSGALEYTVNDVRYEVNAGDMILIASGDTCIRKNVKENVDYISFNFITADKPKLPTLSKDVVRSEMLMLVSAYDKINARAHLDNVEKNAHILACILSVIEDRVRTHNFNHLTLTIIKYLHANLDKKISLDDIGELTFFSPIYCETVFKRDTGKSIIDYFLDERIERAKNLLLEEGLTLAKVAALVGFSDYNYFSRVFKARSGYSPSAYRQMILDSLGTKQNINK